MNLPDLSPDQVVFFCVGTDRSTGDSLGPLVGMMLAVYGYEVFGTLDAPVHAENLRERLAEVPPGKTIIAIDACLGRLSSVGEFKISAGPLLPGSGVGKDLPPVGDYRILGIVNVGGFMEYFVLQNTRLSLVWKMAKQIVALIRSTYPVHTHAEVAAAEHLS